MADGLSIWAKNRHDRFCRSAGDVDYKVFLEPRPNGNGQIRSFASYTDSVTHVEMAFAGSDPYGIFSGAFNSASNGIQWGATAEAGSASV